MRTILVLACSFGLGTLACGPATPEPVTGGGESAASSEGAPSSEAPGGGESEIGVRVGPLPVGEGGGEPSQGGGADQDFDGILDAGDACPEVPEDRDGFQDEDGCAEPDNDGDGLSDVDDLCPAEPEDADGVQDADGCPDP